MIEDDIVEYILENQDLSTPAINTIRNAVENSDAATIILPERIFVDASKAIFERELFENTQKTKLTMDLLEELPIFIGNVDDGRGWLKEKGQEAFVRLDVYDIQNEPYMSPLGSDGGKVSSADGATRTLTDLEIAVIAYCRSHYPKQARWSEEYKRLRDSDDHLKGIPYREHDIILVSSAIWRYIAEDRGKKLSNLERYLLAYTRQLSHNKRANERKSSCALGTPRIYSSGAVT